jgi:hypothetical protein
LCHILFWLYTNTLEQHTASIFRAEDYSTQQPGRPLSIFTSPWKPKILHSMQMDLWSLYRDK